MSRLLTCILTLFILVVFFGCNKPDPKKMIVGTWKATPTVMGKELTWVLTCDADGNAKIRIDEKLPVDKTYEFSDDETLVLKGKGESESSNYKIKSFTTNELILLDAQNNKYVFKREQ